MSIRRFNLYLKGNTIKIIDHTYFFAVFKKNKQEWIKIKEFPSLKTALNFVDNEDI
jgi:hypothetical protein